MCYVGRVQIQIEAGVLPIRIVKSYVSNVGTSLNRNSCFSLTKLFLSDKEPMHETLLFTIRIGSTENTFFYFDLHKYIVT